MSVALVLACGGSASSTAPTATSTGSTTFLTPAVTAASPTVSAGASPTAPAPVATNDEPVGFITDDGVTIRGHLFSAPGPKRRVVIIASTAGDQRSWASAYAGDLAARGIAMVTLDFRGYGETGGVKDDSKLDHDFEAAVRFIRSRDYPQVYVVGVGAGGTAAVKVATRQDLSGVVAVSAPAKVGSLDASQDLPKVTGPKLLLVSRGDVTTLGATGVLSDAQTPAIEGSASGAELLKVPAVRQMLFDFLSK